MTQASKNVSVKSTLYEIRGRFKKMQTRQLLHYLIILLCFSPIYASGHIFTGCSTCTSSVLPKPPQYPFKIETTKAVYSEGESIKLKISIYNEWGTSRTIDTPEGQGYYDFFLKNITTGAEIQFCEIQVSGRITTAITVPPESYFKHEITDFLHKKEKRYFGVSPKCPLLAGTYSVDAYAFSRNSNTITFTVEKQKK